MLHSGPKVFAHKPTSRLDRRAIGCALVCLPIRVRPSIRKFPEDPTDDARADNGSSCGRRRREAVGTREDQKTTFFSENALLDEGIPKRDRASRNRPRCPDPCLRACRDHEIPGGPNLDLCSEAVATKTGARAFKEFSPRRFSICDLLRCSPADCSEEIPQPSPNHRALMISPHVPRARGLGPCPAPGYPEFSPWHGGLAESGDRGWLTTDPRRRCRAAVRTRRPCPRRFLPIGTALPPPGSRWRYWRDRRFRRNPHAARGRSC